MIVGLCFFTKEVQVCSVGAEMCQKKQITRSEWAPQFRKFVLDSRQADIASAADLRAHGTVAWPGSVARRFLTSDGMSVGNWNGTTPCQTTTSEDRMGLALTRRPLVQCVQMGQASPCLCQAASTVAFRC